MQYFKHVQRAYAQGFTPLTLQQFRCLVVRMVAQYHE
jgi:hypothetical protein